MLPQSAAFIDRHAPLAIVMLNIEGIVPGPCASHFGNDGQFGASPQSGGARYYISPMWEWPSRYRLVPTRRRRDEIAGSGRVRNYTEVCDCREPVVSAPPSESYTMVCKHLSIRSIGAGQQPPNLAPAWKSFRKPKSNFDAARSDPEHGDRS
jgi:hypothetical protein